MFQEQQISVLFLSRQLRISNKISTPVIYNGRKETIKRIEKTPATSISTMMLREFSTIFLRYDLVATSGNFCLIVNGIFSF